MTRGKIAIVVLAMLATLACRSAQAPSDRLHLDASSGDSWTTVDAMQLSAAWRQVEVDGQLYVLLYTYDTSWATVPLTYPVGEPHYGARITVYRAEEVATVCGYYVPGGCWDDDPEVHVANALATDQPIGDVTNDAR